MEKVILCGIVMGTIARIITLRVDTRQNPSNPTGCFIISDYLLFPSYSFH
ncbi:YIEGIA domain-containing protein [Lacrimispora sp. AGF001]